MPFAVEQLVFQNRGFAVYRSIELEIEDEKYHNFLQESEELATVTIFDFKGTTGMEKELHLESPIFSNSKIIWQSQICICEENLCNAGDFSSSSSSFWMNVLKIFCCIFIMFVCVPWCIKVYAGQSDIFTVKF